MQKATTTTTTTTTKFQLRFLKKKTKKTAKASVPFLQMVKQSNVIIVFVLSLLIGLEKLLGYTVGRFRDIQWEVSTGGLGHGNATFLQKKGKLTTKVTLPETNSSHLKIGYPKRKLVFQPTIFRRYVCFREVNHQVLFDWTNLIYVGEWFEFTNFLPRPDRY